MARTRVCRSRSFHVPGHRSLAAVCALVLLLATGCSEESRLDRESLQTQIQAELFPDYEGLVSAANCPELVDPVPGQRFVCAAQVGSQIIDVPVELGGTTEALTADIGLDERFVEAREIAVKSNWALWATRGRSPTESTIFGSTSAKAGSPATCSAVMPWMAILAGSKKFSGSGGVQNQEVESTSTPFS